jgi:hypothetical protein
MISDRRKGAQVRLIAHIVLWGVVFAVLLLGVAREGQLRERCKEKGGEWVGLGWMCFKPDAIIK